MRPKSKRAKGPADQTATLLQTNAEPASEAQCERLGADSRLREIYTSEWKWREAQFPDNEYWQKTSSQPISDRLPRVDPATQEMRLRHWEEVLERLDGIPRADLSVAERLNYDVYRPQIEALIASQRFRDYEMPINSYVAFWTDLGYTARRPFRALQDYKNWIAKMRAIPRYFGEQMDQMREGMKRGFTPPRVTLAGLRASIAAVTDPAPEATLFYIPFKNVMGVPEAERATLRLEALKAIKDAVQPAHAQLLQFLLQEYLPSARTTLAAHELPDGAAYYRAKIHEYTTLDLDPAVIHALGIQEVARLHGEMLELVRETGFRGGFPAFLRFLRTDPQFYAKTPEDLLMRAAWIAKTFDGKASQFFGFLPRGRFTIRPVPPDQAPYYVVAEGFPDVYLVNTYDLAIRPLYNLTALTLHESAPGHSFQMAIAAERTDLPEFRRQVFISAYGEGWALYCEKLGAEMGMYETPYDRFGMLDYQIWRAARLAVDTGIHSEGWTRERAIAYLLEYTALPQRYVETEVDRYIAWPAQALSYYLGEMSILQARAKAERVLGETFNIRAFHDAILELGSVPLPVLEARVDRLIAEGGRGPYPEME